MKDYKDGDCQMELQDIYDCLNSNIALCLCNDKVDVVILKKVHKTTRYVLAEHQGIH